MAGLRTECALMLHNLKIANVEHDLKISTQFPECENAQRNLEIVQIPRLHGIYTRELGL